MSKSEILTIFVKKIIDYEAISNTW